MRSGSGLGSIKTACKNCEPIHRPHDATRASSVASVPSSFDRPCSQIQLGPRIPRRRARRHDRFRPPRRIRRAAAAGNPEARRRRAGPHPAHLAAACVRCFYARLLRVPAGRAPASVQTCHVDRRAGESTASLPAIGSVVRVKYLPGAAQPRRDRQAGVPFHRLTAEFLPAFAKRRGTKLISPHILWS